MSRILTIAFSAVTLCAASLPTMAEPDSHSDKRKLDPITCQVRPLDGMALVTGKVCKSDSEWARIKEGFAPGFGPGDRSASVGTTR